MLLEGEYAFTKQSWRSKEGVEFSLGGKFCTIKFFKLGLVIEGIYLTNTAWRKYMNDALCLCGKVQPIQSGRCEKRFPLQQPCKCDRAQTGSRMIKEASPIEPVVLWYSVMRVHLHPNDCKGIRWNYKWPNREFPTHALLQHLNPPATPLRSAFGSKRIHRPVRFAFVNQVVVL